MGRYLIAGAAGYVGSRLADHLLTSGHEVRGLVRTADRDVVQRLAARGMAVWEGDLTDPDSLVGVAHGIEHVFNLTTHTVLDDAQLTQVYVTGNRNLIAACSRSSSMRSYTFAGNVAPYGSCAAEWVTEATPAAPCYPLGDITYSAEQAIMGLVDQLRFPAIVLRIGSIYGPGRDFIAAVGSDTAALIGSGENYLPRVQIDDVIDILARVAEAGRPGAIYNVGDDDPTRAIDFYSTVRARLGMEPPSFVPTAAALSAGIHPSIVGMSAASVRLANERVKSELGIRLRYPSYLTWLNEQLPQPAAIEQDALVAG